ncbi:MAG: hypothetical protein AAB038_04740 [Planctomycetota bacterium]
MNNNTKNNDDGLMRLESGEKTVAYIDICGISEFYKNEPPSEDVAKKIGFGFLRSLDEIKGSNPVSIHILSDSALLVPDDSSQLSLDKLVQLSLILFYNLVENTQSGPANLSRIFITKGTYYYIEYLKAGHRINYTVGGNVLLKCLSADKEEGLPFGVFTDLPEVEIIRKSPFTKWQFVNYKKYLDNDRHQLFNYILPERLLPNIIRQHFGGWDKTSVKLRRYCETLISLLE